MSNWNTDVQVFPPTASYYNKGVGRFPLWRHNIIAQSQNVGIIRGHRWRIFPYSSRRSSDVPAGASSSRRYRSAPRSCMASDPPTCTKVNEKVNKIRSKGKLFYFTKTKMILVMYILIKIEKEVDWVIRKLFQRTIKQCHFLRNLVVFFHLFKNYRWNTNVLVTDNFKIWKGKFKTFHSLTNNAFVTGTVHCWLVILRGYRSAECALCPVDLSPQTCEEGYFLPVNVRQTISLRFTYMGNTPMKINISVSINYHKQDLFFCQLLSLTLKKKNKKIGKRLNSFQITQQKIKHFQDYSYIGYLWITEKGSA